MSRRLIDNVNSTYFEAANHMRPKWKKHKVIAYVESYDDIYFWRDILDEFETTDIGFEIVLPSRTNLNRGKKSAITNNLGNRLGTSMIACVDADLDYLMQGSTPTSKQIINNPYIIHTYVYAIENFQCYAPSLHNVCVMATLNDHKVFDFQAFMEAYSRIIYDIFVWSVWLYRTNQAHELPLNTLCNLTNLHKLNIHNPEEALEKLRHTVNRKVAYMQQHFPTAKGKLKPLKAELQNLGLNPENTYLYMQGHHIMDNIVMELMNPVCTILRRAREREIRQNALHAQQQDNELASYQHSCAPIDQMLRRNSGYKTAPQYQQVRQHVQKLIQLIQQTTQQTTQQATQQATQQTTQQAKDNNT